MAEADEGEIPICADCGSTPCDWIQYQATIKAKARSLYHINSDGVRVDNEGEVVPMYKMRKHLYYHYTRAKFGYLGR